MTNKQNVIVTGGAGFIGSSLCKMLNKSGFNPITIDDLSSGFRQLVKYGDFIEADFGDYEKMIAVFAKYKPLAIFHIAAFKSVSESIENPHKYYENNFSKTNNLLKATVDSDIKHFIFSSSAAIFGQITGNQKVDENYPARPINPYGTSKLMVETLLADYEKTFGLKYSSLRYFNVSGADPECEVGEMSPFVSNIFPVLLRVVSGKSDKFTIFGDNYDTKDGTCVRDYIHVSDLAKAHILALEKQLKNNQSLIVNLGNGSGFSVKEVADIFKKIVGIDFRIEIGNRREGDADFVIADNKLANEYLGWKPEYQDLETQITHSWNWHQKVFIN